MMIAGVLMCSIDNLPAQMPREATSYFGSLLLPHMPDLVRTVRISRIRKSTQKYANAAAEDARQHPGRAAGVQRNHAARHRHQLWTARSGL